MHRRIKSSSLLCIMKQPDHSENHALLRNLIGKLDRKNGLRCNIQIKWTFKWIWYNLYSMSMGAAVNSKPHSMLFQQEEEGVKTVSGMLFKSLFYRTWNLSGCLLEELSWVPFCLCHAYVRSEYITVSKCTKFVCSMSISRSFCRLYALLPNNITRSRKTCHDMRTLRKRIFHQYSHGRSSEELCSSCVKIVGTKKEKYF